MSSKRDADITAIQQALADTSSVPEDMPGSFLPTGPVPDLVPSASPAPTPEQKAADKLAEKTETENLQLIKDQDSLIKAQLGKTAHSVNQAVGSVKNGIGSVGIPGGLGLPLAVLIILFMLLIKVNGNTRLGWLWLVMTGNAEVQTGGSGGSGGETPAQQIEDSPAVFLAANYEPLPMLELDEW